jgi:hypothetical protein
MFLRKLKLPHKYPFDLTSHYYNMSVIAINSADNQTAEKTDRKKPHQKKTSIIILSPVFFNRRFPYYIPGLLVRTRRYIHTNTTHHTYWDNIPLNI